MLRFFKRRKQLPTEADIDADTQETLAVTAELLKMQLHLSAVSSNYEDRFRDEFTRGYLFGFFDAALQNAGIEAKSDTHFSLLVLAGHICLLGDLEAAEAYTMDSLARIFDPVFRTAQIQGGTEYVDFINSKRPPMGLANHFLED